MRQIYSELFRLYAEGRFGRFTVTTNLASTGDLKTICIKVGMFFRFSKFFVIFIALLGCSSVLLAQEVAEKEIPEELKGWVDWATWNESNVPPLYFDQDKQIAAWSTGLDLNCLLYTSPSPRDA